MCVRAVQCIQNAFACEYLRVFYVIPKSYSSLYLCNISKNVMLKLVVDALQMNWISIVARVL